MSECATHAESCTCAQEVEEAGRMDDTELKEVTPWNVLGCEWESRHP